MQGLNDINRERQRLKTPTGADFSKQITEITKEIKCFKPFTLSMHHTN